MSRVLLSCWRVYVSPCLFSRDEVSEPRLADKMRLDDPVTCISAPKFLIQSAISTGKCLTSLTYSPLPCGDIGCRTGNGIMQCSPVQPIQPIFHFLCDILCPHMVFTLLYFLVIPIGSSLFRPLRFLLALLILPAVSFGSGRRERERRHRHCTGHLPVSLRIDRAKTCLVASVTPYNKLTNCLIP